MREVCEGVPVNAVGGWGGVGGERRCLSETRAWPGSPCAHIPEHTGPVSPPQPHTALQTHAYSLKQTLAHTGHRQTRKHVKTYIKTHGLTNRRYPRYLYLFLIFRPLNLFVMIYNVL